MMIYLQTIETGEDKTKFEQIYAEYRGLMFITLLALPKSNYLIQFVVLKINPMARLVLGWQSSGIDGLDVLGGVLRLQNSLSYIVFIVSLILIGGGILVKRHDFITVDAEFGGT